MEIDYLNGQVWCLTPEQDTPAGEEVTEPKKTPISPAEGTKEKPTVGEIARKHGWKVGRKEVRVIGHGGLPDYRVEENGWILMRAIDYEGIVPQEALDRVRTLISEGIEIKGLLIADDLRRNEPGKIHKFALRAMERARTIDWQKGRTAAIQRASVLASAGSTTATSIAGWMRKKVNEVDWIRFRHVSAKGLKAVAIGAAVVAGAVIALPILALAAAPAAFLTLDPWLIVIDSEDRRWVVAEWWD